MRQPDWQTEDGAIRLYCGDCLEVLPELEPGSVDAVITDPPYSSGGMFRGDRAMTTRTKYVGSSAQHSLPDFTGDNRDQRSFLAWCSLWLMAVANASTDGAIAAVFCDWRQLPIMTDALQAGGWIYRGIVTWQKVNARPMLGRFTNQCEFIVWGTEGPRDVSGRTAPGWIVEGSVPNNERLHITEKPVPVMQWLLQPVEDGAVVLDPFCGSASTAIACINTGRRFIGIEKEPKYFDVAVRRITEALQKTALLEPTPKIVQRQLLTA